MITIGIILLVLLVFAFIAYKLYVVVEPNKAHVVIFMGRGRKTYSPHVASDGKKTKTSYFFIPGLMQRTILPLANVKMDIPSFELKDMEVAPFRCEVTTWFRIKDPAVAVEKLDIHGDGGFEEAVRGTLEEQVRGVARAAAMKQEILDIMRDRKTFGNGVEEEVNGALDEWGLELVKLEIVDFTDVEGSSVIKNYEKMREAEIESDSRQKVAERMKEAEIVEAQNAQASGIERAKSEEAVEKANVEKTKNIDIAKQQAAAKIAEQQELANKQAVSAHRTLEVGKAEVEKQATVTTAEGKAEAVRQEGTATADVVALQGKADAQAEEAKGLAQARIIKERGLSEAEAKDKMAEALQKFNEAGITLEQLKAYMAIEIAKYDNLGKALQTAKVNFNNVTGGGNKDAGGLLGLFGPEGGAGFGQFIEAFEATTGKSVAEVVSDVKNAVSSKKES